MTKRERAKAFKELYARLPSVKCQRKCFDHCGVIPSPSDHERDVIEQAAKRPLTIIPHPLSTTQGLPMCSMLTLDGACGVHPIRPMICRLWGAVPEMPCPHGCEVVNPVPEGKAKELLQEAMDIGGDRHAQTVTPYIDLMMKALRQLAKQNEEIEQCE